MKHQTNKPSNGKSYIITGPTSGIGRATAFELAKHGTVILVGRDRGKLDEVRRIIERRGQRALQVVCDVSEPASVRAATAEIAGLGLYIAGLLNNAGIMQMRGATTNALGWDLTYATNHLGPLAFTEALTPHLPDGANVLFVASAVEDPERKPAVAAGFRGGRFISVESSARGKWLAGGSAKPGMDAYATSKQSVLASAMALARETPRLRINAVEPGFTPATSLGSRDANVFVQLMVKTVVPLLVPLFMPFMKILSTPKRAARMLTGILTNESGPTGVYFDERGNPVQGSALVRDMKFQDRVLAETRALLATARA